MQAGSRKRPVIAATDFSPDARAGIKYAAALAQALGRPLKIVNVVTPGPTFSPQTMSDYALLSVRSGQRTVESILGALRMAHPRLSIVGEVDVGNPCDTLVRRSAEAAVLVMGARGHDSYPYRWGTTSENVSSRASCPVMVVRAEGERQTDAPAPAAVVVAAPIGVGGDRASAHAARFAAALAGVTGQELVEVMEGDGQPCDAARIVQAANDNGAAVIVTAASPSEPDGSLTARQIIERDDRPVVIVHASDDMALAR
jgi:nucleotide-binding universal stress UspA family protein